MIGNLQQLENNALAEIDAATTEDEISAVRTKYLGRKGLLTGLLRNIAQVSDTEKPLLGKRCNELKELLNTKIEEALQNKSQLQKENILFKEKIDVTLPGRSVRYGSN
jgi:phenylalanyl-tRNA synthetase alpha chain